MKSLLTLLSAFLLAVPARSQEKNQFVYPSTRAGNCAESYIKAFNSGNVDSIKGFFLRYGSATVSERIPVERRVQRTIEMYQDMGRMEPVKVRSDQENIVTLVSKSEKGEIVELAFEVEPGKQGGLLGIRLDVLEEMPEEGQDETKRSGADLLRAVGAHMDSLSKADRFSGVVLIAYGGQPIFTKAYGFADREAKVPNRPDTKFNIGSINKTFTSIAIHQLVGQGKLSLDDPIGKHLADYPNVDAANKVTIRHLLNMTSGIGDFFGERFEAADKEKIRSINDYLPLFADKPLEFEPGTNRRYSNGGYIVLGAIIERVSGSDYYTYIRENVYKPAEMAETDSYAKNEKIENRAKGYTTGGREGSKEWKSNYEFLPGRGSSAGGGYSTAGDLLKYVNALKDGKLSWGDDRATSGFGIAGGAPGLNAAVEWIPEREYAIIVLANFDPPAAQSVARTIRRWLPE